MSTGRWWKEFKTQVATSCYARDRIVEMHFWMMEVFFEPQYSYSRKMLVQYSMIITALDDLYDTYYCSTEDGDAFGAALLRYVFNFICEVITYLNTLFFTIW